MHHLSSKYEEKNTDSSSYVRVEKKIYLFGQRTRCKIGVGRVILILDPSAFIRYDTRAGVVFLSVVTDDPID